MNSISSLVRDKVARKAQNRRESPSAGAKLTARKKHQQDDKGDDRMYNSRPIAHTGPPIFIYEQAFSQFLLDMEAHDPTSEELESAHDFVTKALQFYSTEDDRMYSIKDALQDSLGIPATTHSYHFDSSFRPDGAKTCAKLNKFPPFSAIFVLKNEIGEGDSDPLAQAECVYTAVYGSHEVMFINWR
jgi:hypothetical protein